MEWVEVTAKTVEEAKDRALDYLGVDEAQAEFEVLEEPRRGLLGRMRGDARVRARVKPSHPRPKAERRDRRRGRKRDEGERSSSGNRRGAREGAGAKPASGSAGRPSRSAASSEGGEAVSSSSAAADDPATAGAARSGGNGGTGTAARKRRRRRPSDGDDRGARDARDGRAADAQANEEVDHVTLARELEAADQFLTGLVNAFGLEATVQVGDPEAEIQEIAITGEDLGLLIGPKGSTLEAVQELTRLAARRQVEGRAEGRIRVDVSGYRERRRAALERFVRGLAEEVRASGAQKALEPMTSPDRKVVHDTVAELEGVATLSEGEEPNRRVVIIPAP